MEFRLIQLLICIGILQPIASASIADWVWGSSEKNNENTGKRNVRDGVDMPDVPFEVMSNDERFLQEAQYFGLATTSQIDSCQQNVVLRLRSSCADLTEEQLAKFSVALLNCEAAAAGRPQYPCNEEMTLRECTGEMDPDTWNTYHLMNNRARAVCLSARQAQFRVLTEMTVNKLMSSAQGQLDAMSSLKEGQEKLSSLTEGTFQTVSDGQKSLLEQQESLRAAQRNSHSFVAHSLKELGREKALVAAGHRELKKLAEAIKQKLDLADEELQSQSSERRVQHLQLLSDLRTLQSQATQIWQDIDISTREILSRHEIAVQQYEHTLQSLRTINTTVTYLQNLLEVTRKEVDQRLGWISDTLGGAGGQLDLVIACLMHLGYLLMAMLTTAFLGAPACTRILLLILVSLNVIQLLRQGPDAAMSLPATTLVLALGTGLHQLIHALHHMLYPPIVAGAIKEPTTARANGTATPIKSDTPSIVDRIQNKARELWEKIRTLLGLVTERLPRNPVAAASEESNDEESSDEGDSGLEEPMPRAQMSFARLRRVEENTGSRESTPSRTQRSRSGTPSRPDTPRQLCGAKCVNGQACRLPATVTGMCFRHSRQHSNTPH